ncbi:MAG: MFS transporter, partial [Acetobacteraceae bacterium]|nr:MFS transporter [Acetobacteraceae bacterium]
MPIATQAAHRRGAVLLTLCLGVLIAQVDTSVVNLALRPIGAGLRVGVAQLQWVVDGYNLAHALLLLTGGLLADLLGRRRIFISGAAVFSAGCVA